ncbi:Hkr1p SCDLUD_003304 [Saccharomycodes ludwigii]|uniref:Hkr1p n=1 Tax=Saccharomycodes ludwigii TaxID=36035 RepID=UPI001E85563B|nr:hypothetical protein SCDLUD_003304 [Saccharomycodes ludwigii]KAH3900330.1 hypothetical protein SCDLUD_003304 [Saccharomycodes ludwigii]
MNKLTIESKFIKLKDYNNTQVTKFRLLERDVNNEKEIIMYSNSSDKTSSADYSTNSNIDVSDISEMAFVSSSQTSDDIIPSNDIYFTSHISSSSVFQDTSTPNAISTSLGYLSQTNPIDSDLTSTTIEPSSVLYSSTSITTPLTTIPTTSNSIVPDYSVSFHATSIVIPSSSSYMSYSTSNFALTNSVKSFRSNSNLPTTQLVIPSESSHVDTSTSQTTAASPQSVSGSSSSSLNSKIPFVQPLVVMKTTTTSSSSSSSGEIPNTQYPDSEDGNGATFASGTTSHSLATFLVDTTFRVDTSKTKLPTEVIASAALTTSTFSAAGAFSALLTSTTNSVTSMQTLISDIIQSATPTSNFIMESSAININTDNINTNTNIIPTNEITTSIKPLTTILTSAPTIYTIAGGTSILSFDINSVSNSLTGGIITNIENSGSLTVTNTQSDDNTKSTMHITNIASSVVPAETLRTSLETLDNGETSTIVTDNIFTDISTYSTKDNSQIVISSAAQSIITTFPTKISSSLFITTPTTDYPNSSIQGAVKSTKTFLSTTSSEDFIVLTTLSKTNMPSTTSIITTATTGDTNSKSTSRMSNLGYISKSTFQDTTKPLLTFTSSISTSKESYITNTNPSNSLSDTTEDIINANTKTSKLSKSTYHRESSITASMKGTINSILISNSVVTSLTTTRSTIESAGSFLNSLSSTKTQKKSTLVTTTNDLVTKSESKRFSYSNTGNIKGSTNIASHPKQSFSVTTDISSSSGAGKVSATTNLIYRTESSTIESSHIAISEITSRVSSNMVRSDTVEDSASSVALSTFPLTSTTGNSNTNWVPTEIWTKTSKAFSSTLTNNITPTSVNLPQEILPHSVPSQLPSDYTLISIGFKKTWAYPFLVANPISSAQLFAFLPSILIYPFQNKTIDPDTMKQQEARVHDNNCTSAFASANVTFSNCNAKHAAVAQTLANPFYNVSFLNVTVKDIVPLNWDNTSYTIAIAEVYFPKVLVNELQAMILNNASSLYQNPKEYLQIITSLINPRVPLLGIISSHGLIISSNTDTVSTSTSNALATKSNLATGTTGPTQQTGLGGDTGSLGGDINEAYNIDISPKIRVRFLIFLLLLSFIMVIYIWSILVILHRCYKIDFIKKRLGSLGISSSLTNREAPDLENNRWNHSVGKVGDKDNPAMYYKGKDQVDSTGFGLNKVNENKTFNHYQNFENPFYFEDQFITINDEFTCSVDYNIKNNLPVENITCSIVTEGTLRYYVDAYGDYYYAGESLDESLQLNAESDDYVADESSIDDYNSSLEENKVLSSKGDLSRDSMCEINGYNETENIQKSCEPGDCNNIIDVDFELDENGDIILITNGLEDELNENLYSGNADTIYSRNNNHFHGTELTTQVSEIVCSSNNSTGNGKNENGANINGKHKTTYCKDSLLLKNGSLVNQNIDGYLYSHEEDSVQDVNLDYDEEIEDDESDVSDVIIGEIDELDQEIYRRILKMHNGSLFNITNISTARHNNTNENGDPGVTGDRIDYNR